MDLPGGDEVFKKVRKKYAKAKPMAVSVATGEGLSKLLDRVIRTLNENEPPAALIQTPADGRLVKVDAGFEVERGGEGVFHLRGRFVERAAAMLDGTLPEAVARFQGALKRIGVDRALKKAGIKEGDAVRCGSVEFDWSDAPRKRLPHIKRHKRTRIGVGKGGNR
jgi:GTP-binding protein